MAGGPASLLDFSLPFLPPASLHLRGHVPLTMLQGTGQISSNVSCRIRFEPNQGLPYFEEVCQLRRPVLRFVPAKARPAFARPP